VFVDSHCHLDFPDLVQNLDAVMQRMRDAQVTHALCVSVTLEKLAGLRSVARAYENLFSSVGVHPDYEGVSEPNLAELVALAQDPGVVAIGETGLDYFRIQGDAEWQRERFRTHIRAAKACALPLIVHTRAAAADTIRILREEGAESVGGVMHCFTESWEIACAAIDLGFKISFSGILTFKNAEELRATATRLPPESLLIETDSPYHAAAPYRGKTNEPSFVPLVAAQLAQLRGVGVETIGALTTENFFNLFRNASCAKTG
jgi:TatD DNase family protein